MTHVPRADSDPSSYFASDADNAATPARDGWIPKLIVVVWALALLGGMGFLWRYKSTPGTAPSPARVWPESAWLSCRKDRPTLVLFAHPECPCTTASLHALRELLPHYAGRVASYVAVLRPDVTPRGWSDAELRSELVSMPETSLLPDPEGREARLFGAATSGHVFLYGKDGQLLFSGGITGARGHEGENPGLTRLRGALDAELAGEPRADLARAPVFGCALFSDGPTHPEEP